MEKRFIVFVVISVVIMAGFIGLQMFFAPAKKPGANQPIPLAEKKNGKELEKKPKAERTPEDPKEPAEGPKKPAEKKPKLPRAPEPPPEWFALGSLDPKTGYRMVVYFTNQGAAIECIELSSPKYLDLEALQERAGYLGHLALTEAKGGGCLVNVVGPGTPAANATAPGLSPGLLKWDVIESLNGAITDDPVAFQEVLRHIKPKQTVELGVRRTVGGATNKFTFTTDLIHKPLEMVRPEFGSTTDPSPSEPHPLSLLLTLHSIGPVNEDESGEGATKIKRGQPEIPGLPSLHSGRWKTKSLEGDSPGIEFRYLLDEDALEEIGQSGRLEVVKRFRLAPAPEDKLNVEAHKSYHLEYELELVNLGKKPQQVAYKQGGPTGLPQEGWWYQNKIHPGWASAGARDVIWSTKNVTHQLRGCPLIYDNATAKKPIPTVLIALGDVLEKRQLNYAGVDAQYFTTGLIPYDFHEQANTAYEYATAEATLALVKKDKSGRKTSNTTFDLVSPAHTIEPGESFKHSFILFAGPKEPYLLSEYRLDRAIEYGWFPWVAKPLSAILHFFHTLVGNYGVAIIMLTVLVRACLFPVGRRMAKNMQAMQDLQPEMKAIKEKYKDDLAKQGKAQQELMRKHGVNPYAGCLPLFLQMPIFLGLYRALSVDIALRQAPLIPGLFWCSNLAGPDMLWKWKGILWSMLADESGYLGPYLNVFPLVTAGLFLLQQKLFTPPPTDEQQEMQHKMMKFMTIFMSVMFFKVPAGLCVYFITSSLWGIAERTLMMPKKKTGDDAAGKPVFKKSPDKPGTNGAGHKESLRKKQKTERGR